MEIHEIASELRKNTEATIHQSETETPYKDGDHCMFYAIQEASRHFTGQFVAEKTRDDIEVESKNIRKMDIEMIGYGEAATFAVVLPRLREIGVLPKTIHCSDEQFENITTLLENHNTKFAKATPEQDMDFPAVMIYALESNPKISHLFFASNEMHAWQQLNKPWYQGSEEKPVLIALLSLTKEELSSVS